MILVDPPTPVVFRTFRRASHCMSTLIGEEGTRELLAFGVSIGLHESWLQNRGMPTEHFDLFDRAFGRAVKAGAKVVPSRGLVELVVKPKRRAAAARGEER